MKKRLKHYIIITITITLILITINEQYKKWNENKETESNTSQTIKYNTPKPTIKEPVEVIHMIKLTEPLNNTISQI